MLRKWYSNLTLRSKVTGFTAAITALALGVVATMSIWQIHRQIDAEQHRAAGTVAMSIARASQLALTVGDAKELSRLANSYLHDQDILFVAIYGQHPTALATAVVDQRAWDEFSSGMAEDNRFIVGQEEVTALEQKDEFSTGIDAEAGDPLAAKPAPASKGPVGRVVVGLSTSSLHAAQSRQSFSTAMTTALAASVGGIAIYLILGSWTRRLQRLADASQVIARGDFGAPIDDLHEDEIGRLARSFEQMRLAVHLREQKLRNFTDTLQDQVKHRTLQLEKALAAAEEASKAKSMFLANMSHELRTPLNGVIGMVDLLLATETSAQQKRYCDVAKVSARSLLDLISDILDFSKIEAGKLELESTDFDLHGVADDVVRMMGPRAEQKSLKLACIIGPHVPRNAAGDPTRLRQILMNLLSNSLKFTERGEVTISISLVEQDASNAKLKFEVRDTGVGIPKDRLDRLFKSFSQVDASTTRKFGGTGLGLAISQRIVGMMGGTMGVESAEGKGSNFWFTAVLAKRFYVVQKNQRLIESSDKSSQQSLKGKRVLLAEDNEVNRMVAEELLKQAGCVVTMVMDGRQALEETTQRRFDAVLMDCQMPVMDGFEATKQIRQREKSSGGKDRLPIIALTANAIKGDREICLAAGMDGYVTKPIDPPALFAALRECISRDGSESALATPPAEKSPETPPPARIESPPPAPSAPPAPDLPVDFEALRRRCLGNRKVAASALAKFGDLLEPALEELNRHISAHDGKAARQAAHKLKGSAGNVSATSIQRVAAELEKMAQVDLSQAEQTLNQLRVEADRLKLHIESALKSEIESALSKPGGNA
ncbi:MAG: ATP-binding protein [Tepidisphaeraceae bacterium]|jgi:TMAO reductase system sensor TorS